MVFLVRKYKISEKNGKIMENENKTLIEKIRDEIIANGGLTTAEIASKFLGIKNGGGAASKILVEKIFKDHREFSFDGEKWQAKILPPAIKWEKAQFTKENFETAPATFGVFGFYDENKKVIFVGSATNLRERLLEIWNKNEESDEKMKQLRGLAVSYIVSTCKDDMTALDTEMKLIEKHKPILN